MPTSTQMILIVVLVSAVDSLQCWGPSWNSNNLKLCKAIGGHDVNNSTCLNVTCPEDGISEFGCMRLSEFAEIRGRRTRTTELLGCVSANKMSCFKSYYRNTEATVCFCDTNFCNGVSPIDSSVESILIPLIVAAYVDLL